MVQQDLVDLQEEMVDLEEMVARENRVPQVLMVQRVLEVIMVLREERARLVLQVHQDPMDLVEVMADLE